MNRWQKCAWIVPALTLLTVPNSWTTSGEDQQPVSGNDNQINKSLNRPSPKADRSFVSTSDFHFD
jgi:hypothetical protein